MRWCAPGFEDALQALRADLGDTAWPGPPHGFALVGTPRPMRVVLRGVMEASAGRVPVVVKWSRPDRIGDHVSKRVRGGKGAREGQVLRALAAAGVGAPEALAYTDEGTDLLVTRECASLSPVGAIDDMVRERLAAGASLLAAAHAAGLRHRDLHLGNVALREGQPCLIDLGSARIGPPMGGAPEEQRDHMRALAALRHTLLEDARRSQRFRALVLYLSALGRSDARQHARTLARTLEAEALLVRRRYRKGRDRRATRSGKHYRLFNNPEGSRGVRFRDETNASWEERAAAWLDAPVAKGRSLKDGGRVLQLDVDGRQVVFKYYEAAAPGRTSRAVRAFRRAAALQNRRVPVPQPLMAVENEGGSLYIAAHVAGENLHDLLAPGGSFKQWAPGARRRLLIQLGRCLRQMHEAEVSNRDLKPPNLVVEGGAENGRVLLVDLDGVRIRKQPISWKRRARDLSRLDAGIAAHATDRLRLLQAYWNVPPRPPIPQRDFLTWIARGVRRKRGPSGLPR